jgi:glutathione S-transferase
MSLELYFHPLSSFCQKALIALYENDTSFEPKLVNLMDPGSRAEFVKIWPIGKFPVLRDTAAGRTVPESTIIIEYLDRHYPGKTKLIPDDPERASEVREWDRFFDLHLHLPMQKMVADRLRPDGKHDPYGVEDARHRIDVALDLAERRMAGRSWAVGDAFSMADCSAAPPLFYLEMLRPFAATHPNAAAYLARLKARPSYARALAEAKPYLAMVPKETATAPA